jgi:hypothetical protein
MREEFDQSPTGRVRALRSLLSGVRREEGIEVLADFRPKVFIAGEAFSLARSSSILRWLPLN